MAHGIRKNSWSRKQLQDDTYGIQVDVDGNTRRQERNRREKSRVRAEIMSYLTRF